MKIWFISDTHNEHEGLEVPAEIDAVVHCGDESIARYPALNEPEARAFFKWYAALQVPLKVYVPGNHSTAVEQGLIRREEYPDIQFLIHESLEAQGLRFFGTPYTPEFADWAYMKPRRGLGPVWKSIPAEVDILITHGPPKGILDVTKDFDTLELIHVGSQSLTRQVEERIRPKVHSFGHIHDERGVRNYGMLVRDGIRFINCSCCDNVGRLVNNGFVVEIKPPVAPEGSY